MHFFHEATSRKCLTSRIVPNCAFYASIAPLPVSVSHASPVRALRFFFRFGFFCRLTCWRLTILQFCDAVARVLGALEPASVGIAPHRIPHHFDNWDNPAIQIRTVHTTERSSRATAQFVDKKTRTVGTKGAHSVAYGKRRPTARENTSCTQNRCTLHAVRDAQTNGLLKKKNTYCTLAHNIT